MSKFTNGAQNAVECLAVKKSDRVIIVTDLETKHIASAIRSEIEKVGAKVLWLEIEKEVGKRPVENFPKTFQKKISDFKPNVSYYIASGKKGELPKFRHPLMRFFTQELKCRHGHMIGIQDRLMLEGMSADYDKVYDITMKIYKLVKDAKRIRVKADGTELVAELSPKLRWKPLSGRITEQGDMGNLPDGEVLTCPKSVNGKISAYVVGDYFSLKYGVLKDPLVLEVINSRVAKVTCKNKELEEEFKQYIGEEKNGNRVGEFAIGTLVGLKKFIGNLLQDEKFPGIHIGFGATHPEHTGADWDCDSHVDLIPKNCSIWVDPSTSSGQGQKLIMKDGEFVV